MSDKKHWITKLVPALAFAAGIIIASVGGIMTLSSSLKLATFDSGPYSYVNEEQCRYNYVSLTGKGSEPTERTEAEFEKCINKQKQEEMTRFQKNQKENIVDGISALIVGGLLLMAFRRRE
jgi:hypothetical protein